MSRRTTAAVTGAPPVASSRSVAGSAPEAAAASRVAGTAYPTVAERSAAVRAKVGPSAPSGANDQVAPATSTGSPSIIWSVCTTSSGRRPRRGSRACSPAARVAREWVTARGAAVVPEVNTTSARASGSVGGGSAAGAPRSSRFHPTAPDGTPGSHPPGTTTCRSPGARRSGRDRPRRADRPRSGPDVARWTTGSAIVHRGCAVASRAGESASPAPGSATTTTPPAATTARAATTAGGLGRTANSTPSPGSIPSRRSAAAPRRTWSASAP